MTAPSRAPEVLEERAGADTGSVEAAYAGILAEVLRIDRVSVESHFFDDLAADSLVMAHFCARVRKRGNLPHVSMRDVYAHSTIRALAAALTEVEAEPAAVRPVAPVLPPTPVRRAEYIFCGVLQAIFFLAYSHAAMLGIIESFRWVSAALTPFDAYVRLVAASSAAFLITSLIPIAAKWALIGRWKQGEIRLWSLAYVRFWIVKVLVRSSPVVRLSIGTPLLPLYLRALGARVGRGTLILSRQIPVCTDLLTIGAGTIIRKDALLNCYRAVAGRIETGTVSIGRDVFIGERTVLEINTSVGDGAQLGHTSALQPGDSVPAGERWHGSPAVRTEFNYLRIPPARSGPVRAALYTAVSLAFFLMINLPLLQAAARLMFDAAEAWALALVPGATPVTLVLVESLVLSTVSYFTLVLVGLPLTIAVTRTLCLFVQPGVVHPLYGWRDAVHRMIGNLGKRKFFTTLFGDSSYIVPYLEWVGFRLKPVVQTGSNFGTQVTSANPRLSAVGSGTMVADGLVFMNDDVTTTSFRVAMTSIGRDNFLGNNVAYPAGGRTGDNVLMGTKVMVPLDGPVREGVGLLGSPPFQIPRTVERDAKFDHLMKGEALVRGLKAKNRYNLRSMVLYLATRWLGTLLLCLLYVAATQMHSAVPYVVTTGLFTGMLLVTGVYYTMLQRVMEAKRPLRPTVCSIYHTDFWWVERLWKMLPIGLFRLYDGTPFKSWFLRLQGIKVGSMVFDDGVHCTEPSLTTIGDEVVLNTQSCLQCHSQEDGTFKADRSVIGARSTVGVAAHVHYGVTMGEESHLAADSYLMKGEDVPARARWAGNVARQISEG